MTRPTRTPDPAPRTEKLPADDPPLRLSPDRAFVVQLGAGGDQLSGRVEHLTTGAARRFRSSGELLRFMARFSAVRGEAGR